MGKVNAEIRKAVRMGSSTYLPDNEAHAEAFLAVCTPRQAKRLLGLNAVAGSAFEAIAKKVDEDEETEAKAAAARKSAKTEDPKTEGEDSPLPAGFPSRQILIAAGFDTVGKVKGAADEELEALKGIGEGSIAAIRDTLG